MPISIFAPADQWPVIDGFDVAVIGAGPGGIGAAVAAARGGARTLLIERSATPGGMATNGNCPNIMGYGSGGRQIIGGIADELARRLDAAGHGRLKAGRHPDPDPIADRPLLSPVISTVHGIRLIANRMLAEAGVERLYFASLVGAIREGGRVTAAAIDRLEGPALVKAKTFVDASGDAALVWRAGGRVHEAEPDEAMTKTILFDVGGAPDFEYDAARAAFMKAVEEKRVPVAIQTSFMSYGGRLPGEVALNYTAVAGDALSSEDMTRMDVELREQVEEGVAWFRESVPAFADCHHVRSACTVGIRAGRSAVGRETITQSDIDDDAPVARPVAIGLRRYGDHGTKAFAAAWRKPVDGTRPIPFETLLSADFENVVMAGRSISCEQRMLTCVRYMAQCMATGQAAGTTAALSVAKGGALADVGYDAVRERLVEGGAIVE